MSSRSTIQFASLLYGCRASVGLGQVGCVRDTEAKVSNVFRGNHPNKVTCRKAGDYLETTSKSRQNQFGYKEKVFLLSM